MKAKFLICMIASVYAAVGDACTAKADCDAIAATGKTACCGYLSTRDAADTRTCWADDSDVDITKYVAAVTASSGLNTTTSRYGCTSYGNSGNNLKAGVLSLFTGIATHALLA